MFDDDEFAVPPPWSVSQLSAMGRLFVVAAVDGPLSLEKATVFFGGVIPAALP